MPPVALGAEPAIGPFKRLAGRLIAAQLPGEPLPAQSAQFSAVRHTVGADVCQSLLPGVKYWYLGKVGGGVRDSAIGDVALRVS